MKCTLSVDFEVGQHTIDAARDWLTERGFVREEGLWRAHETWVMEGQDVDLPTMPDCVDFGRRMGEAINAMAWIVGADLLSVARDLGLLP